MMQKPQKRESFAEIGVCPKNLIYFSATENWLSVFKMFGKVMDVTGPGHYLLIVDVTYDHESVEKYLRWRVEQPSDDEAEAPEQEGQSPEQPPEKGQGPECPSTKGETQMIENKLGHVLREKRKITFNSTAPTFEVLCGKYGAHATSYGPRYPDYIEVPEDQDFDAVLMDVAALLDDGEHDHYCFETVAAGEIDIQRICDENVLADAILVTFEGNEETGLLLVNERFVSRFEFDDGLKLAGEYLSPRWGYSRFGLKRVGNVIRPRHDFGSAQLIGWRVKVVDLPAKVIAKELEAARAFEHRIVTKVHRL